MTKKNLALLLALVMVFGLLSACGGNTTTSNAPSEEPKESAEPAESAEPEESAEPVESAEPEDPGVTVPAFEDIVFPDNLPQKPPMADPGLYGYDDMTERYQVELLCSHYGVPLDTDTDIVAKYMGDKFNMDITYTTINSGDADATLSTRFAGEDEPDIIWVSNRDIAFTLSDQGLLWDAKKIYPYMPQTCKFVTNNMITWSTNKSNGELPFITKYGIQDGVWGWAIRKDWMEKFGMTEPKSKAELIAFAKACVEQDPDGNGKADTYFTAGAGEGKGWGMLGGFADLIGRQGNWPENGELVSAMKNDNLKNFLMFIKELNDMNVLCPDWFTIGWEPNKANTHGDKLGMVWYPAGALIAEYVNAKIGGTTYEQGDGPVEALDAWHFWKESPIEGGKYGAAGNPGYCWGFSTRKVDSDAKMMRLAHMLDTMVIGGENFGQTIQGSTDEVYEAAGLELNTSLTLHYQDDGTFFLRSVRLDGYSDEFGRVKGETNKQRYDPLGCWQVFGLSVIWQISDPVPKTDFPYEAKYIEKTNSYAQVINSYERWPNTGLAVTITGEAAEASAQMADWNFAQQTDFVFGKRDFAEWDQYVQEWLDKGGKLIIAQTAECFEVPVPEWAK